MDGPKYPLQALLFDNNWSDIIAGKKWYTIRLGHKLYQAGKPVMLCCHIANLCLMADITKVTHCKFKDINFPYYNTTCNELFNQAQYHYAILSYDDEITMIEWNNIRGSLYAGSAI